MNCFPRYCGVGLLSCLSFVLSAIVFAEEVKPTDWPQWRGPTRDSRVVGTQWPDSLDKNHLELSWEVEQGPSYSGPIVVGNRVFTTETDEKNCSVLELIQQFSCGNGLRMTASWNSENPYSTS